jgi:hypothetical protein
LHIRWIYSEIAGGINGRKRQTAEADPDPDESNPEQRCPDPWRNGATGGECNCPTNGKKVRKKE